MIRSPAVAGQFYAGTAKGLMEQVASMVDPKAKKADVMGAVVPHAGLMYSGPVAGAVYSRMTIPDTFVLIGPDHHGTGADFSIMTDGLWRTPLGEVRVDSILAKEIFKNSANLADDHLAQTREHSLEVQLPFMQYLGLGFEIVPISLRHYAPDAPFLAICEEIGRAISKAISHAKHRVTIVASTDLTHYESQKSANEKDRAALDAIEAMDPQGLFRAVAERDISMCGYAAVASAIVACRQMGAKRAEIVKYMTSGDTTGDYSAVVGYGGAIIRR